MIEEEEGVTYTPEIVRKKEMIEIDKIDSSRELLGIEAFEEEADKLDFVGLEIGTFDSS